MRIVEIVQAQTMENAPTFAEVGGNVVNFMLGITGFIGVIGLVLSAVIYFTAGGDENRISFAKKSSLYSIVGMFVALGALVVFSQIDNLLR